jgi:2-polyprenyl-6-methoxyphenol hydroxylase-like FAD-dependent oxidoreductase
LGIYQCVHKIAIKNDGYLIAAVDYSQAWSCCWSGNVDGAIGDIGRGQLRDLLLEKCVETGVEVKFGAKLIGIGQGGGEVVIEQSENRTKNAIDQSTLASERTIHCAGIIGADGVFSTVGCSHPFVVETNPIHFSLTASSTLYNSL